MRHRTWPRDPCRLRQAFVLRQAGGEGRRISSPQRTSRSRNPKIFASWAGRPGGWTRPTKSTERPSSAWTCSSRECWWLWLRVRQSSVVRLKGFSADKARAVSGVRHVVQIPRGVAVVADGFWAAKKGREALELVWDDGPLAGLDTLPSSSSTPNWRRSPV